MTPFINTDALKLSPSGAHLVHADSPEGELLFLSSTSKYGEGESIRGGVPIIAPWFGELLGVNPSHGWARRSLWDVQVDGTDISAAMQHEGLSLKVNVTATNDGIAQTLELENISEQSHVVQLAFHPYFKVSDVEHIEIQGFDGIDLLNRATATTEKQTGPITFSGEFDRIALGTPLAKIVDRERIITVRGEGYDSTVVWNPGEKLASSMADIGPGEWRDFVCVEPALLGDDQQGVSVAPGESITIGMAVSVEKRV